MLVTRDGRPRLADLGQCSIIPRDGRKQLLPPLGRRDFCRPAVMACPPTRIIALEAEQHLQSYVRTLTHRTLVSHRSVLARCKVLKSMDMAVERLCG